MQFHNTDTPKSILPEERLRSYDQGNVTVYPLEGPIPADKDAGGGARYSKRAPQFAHDDPAVTVYSLEEDAETSTTTAQVEPVESVNNAGKQKQAAESRQAASQQGFERQARQHAVPVPLSAGGQDIGAQRNSGQNADARNGEGGQAASFETRADKDMSGDKKQNNNKRLLTAP